MSKYTYNGPVMIFDRCVINNWKGETIADTQSKAKSNLAYQFKQQNNLIPSSRVSLPGKLTLI